ncbi:MAG: hypothetical protein ACXABV_12460 [Candidatus Thorarchaeota archaeon]|jgi:hypothetical protein
MVNKEKASKRDLIRIRKTQNPQQIDFRKMRKHRKARTKFWSFKKTPSTQVVTAKKEKTKPKKKARRKKKEPELEVIEDEPEVFDQEPELEVIEEKDEEPELEVIDEELEDLYSYDDEILDDEELEKLEE